MRSPKRLSQLDRAVREAPSAKNTVVYLLQVATNQVKFGHTARGSAIRKFEGMLFNAFPCKVLLEVQGSQTLEQLLKARFAHLSVDGREIFRYEQELKNYIRKLRRWRG